MSDPAGHETGRAAARRWPRQAVLLALVGLVVTEVFLRGTWVRAEASTGELSSALGAAGLRTVHGSSKIGAVLVLVPPAAVLIALLAGVWMRRLLGVVAAAAAALAVALAAHVLADPAAAARPPGGALPHHATTTVLPWLTLVGLVVMLAAGALTLVTAGRWPRGGERYERGERVATRARPVSDWEALERGDDPTSAG